MGDPLDALQATKADVAARRDEALLNVGLLWVRASSATVALTQRVANRSTAAWDQAVFSEEVAAPSIVVGGRQVTVSCCYINEWIGQCVVLRQQLHELNKSPTKTSVSQHSGCRDSSTLSRVLPPLGSPLPPPAGAAVLFPRWDPTRYNDPPMWTRSAYSRCSRQACPRGAERPTPERHGACGLLNYSTNTISSRVRHVEIAAVAKIRPPSASRSEQLQCTHFPEGTEGLPDVARCSIGNARRDGYVYVYNSNRGTARAACGIDTKCACCRRRMAHP